jgi:hypothetical protein
LHASRVINLELVSLARPSKCICGVVSVVATCEREKRLAAFWSKLNQVKSWRVHLRKAKQVLEVCVAATISLSSLRVCQLVRKIMRWF